MRPFLVALPTFCERSPLVPDTADLEVLLLVDEPEPIWRATLLPELLVVEADPLRDVDELLTEEVDPLREVDELLDVVAVPLLLLRLLS